MRTPLLRLIGALVAILALSGPVHAQAVSAQMRAPAGSWATAVGSVRSDGVVLQNGPHIIPQPNSGQAPTREGDRGSFSQFAVLGGILLGFAAIFFGIRRDARKKKAIAKAKVGSNAKVERSS